jgi:S-adenosylmethionine decarboxylase
MTKVHHMTSDRTLPDDGELSKEPKGVGQHAIIELYECPYDLLNDEGYVCHAIRHAAGKACTHLLKLISHQFSPQGVTALGLLSESHISIHTWPEKGYAAADFFTCSPTTRSIAFTRELSRLFQAGRHSARYLPRGDQILDSVVDLSSGAKDKVVF